jgi:hypothetical protein
VFLDLDEVKRQLNKTGNTDDSDLTAYINAAAKVVERHTGHVPTPTEFTDQLTLHSLTGTIRVTHKPLISVTSITVEGDDIDPTTVQTRKSGLIRLNQHVRGWVDVTYQAGETTVPDNWAAAGLIIVQHLWSTRRGNMISTNDPLNTPLEFRQPIAPYAIPNKALELLGPAVPSVF